MFVPTHIDRNTYIEFIFSGDKLWMFALNKEGELWCNHVTNQFNHQLTKIEPLTLSCPYCHATINQSERIECGCGWIVRAVDQEMLEFLDSHSLGITHEGIVKQRGLPKPLIGYFIDYATCAYPECIDTDQFTVYFINGINWLEIQPGKEKAEPDPCPECGGSGYIDGNDTYTIEDDIGIDMPDEICPECGGSGDVQVDTFENAGVCAMDTCPTCYGTGRYGTDGSEECPECKTTK